MAQVGKMLPVADILDRDAYRPRPDMDITSYAAHLESVKRAERLTYCAEENVPPRVLQAFESLSWRETQASLAAVKAVKEGAHIVLLHGPPGTGKSCAAGAVLLLPVFEGRDGYRFVGTWIRASEYCAGVMARRMRNPIPEAERSRRAEGALYLVLDDAGEEGPKDNHHVQALITSRYDHPDKVTLITTNLSGKDFFAAYGARVSSRIKHVGRAILCDQVVRPGE